MNIALKYSTDFRFSLQKGLIKNSNNYVSKYCLSSTDAVLLQKLCI